MVVDAVRAQALLHGGRSGLLNQFVSLRHRAVARDAHRVSSAARSRRRRTTTGIAGDPEGHLRGGTAGDGICAVWNGGSAGENTGFTEVDLGILLDSADLGIGNASAGTDAQAVADQEILASQAELAKQTAPEPSRKEITQEERQKLRDTKAALKAKLENDTGFYLTVIFKDGDSRKKFLEQLKLPEVEQYVSGQTLMDVLFENATS